MKYLLCLFSLIMAVGLNAQSTRDVQLPKPPAPKYQAYKKESKVKNFFSRFTFKKEVNEVEDFRERVSDSYRKRARAERKADKPKYRDPTYFGHKKPPKKRPPGKQKFCKECGMKH